MKRAAKHGRYKNKRDEGWGGSHGWLRLKRSRGDKGERGGDVAMTSQHTEREGTGRDGKERNGKGREGKEREGTGRERNGTRDGTRGGYWKPMGVRSLERLSRDLMSSCLQNSSMAGKVGF